jgi:hypothetical protein
MQKVLPRYFSFPDHHNQKTAEAKKDFGSLAVYFLICRPMTLRPHLTMGLPFRWIEIEMQGHDEKKYEKLPTFTDRGVRKRLHVYITQADGKGLTNLVRPFPTAVY